MKLSYVLCAYTESDDDIKLFVDSNNLSYVHRCYIVGNYI